MTWHRVSPICNACYACVSICPVHAIAMVSKADDVAMIDASKCTGCNLCRRICPTLHKPLLPEVTTSETYAAISKDPVLQRKSSSGGIVGEIARTFIEHGGMVVGASMGRDLRVRHIAIEDTGKLAEIRGSKYSRSNLEEIYPIIEDKLQVGQDILFIGLPCQIDGLKRRFSKSGEQSHLFTIDLVCHGVVPMTWLKTYLQTLSIPPGDVDMVAFRGEYGYALALMNRDASLVYHGTIEKDLYMNGFYYGWLLASNCFSCSYTSSQRLGDLTVGDYWGLGHDSDFTVEQRKDGVSLVMVNNDRGNRLWAMAQNNLFYEKRTCEECIRGNTALRQKERRDLLYFYFRLWYRLSNLQFAFKALKLPAKLLVNFKHSKQHIKKGLQNIKFFVESLHKSRQPSR